MNEINPEQENKKPLAAATTQSIIDPLIAAQLENHSSVKLVRNAKGQTQIEVKIYNKDPHVAQKQSVDIYNSLDKEYNTGI